MNLKIITLIIALFMGLTASAADLPDPIREVSRYLAMPKSFHVGVILTNYKPTAIFRNKQDFRKAAKLFEDSKPPASEISYFEYAATDIGMVYKEIYVDPLQSSFPPTSALTAKPFTLFLGRSRDVWWYATEFPKTPNISLLAVNALVDSNDGVQLFPGGQNNPYFRTLVLDEGSLFSHLKLGPFSPNTFQVHPTKRDGKYTWTAINQTASLKGGIQMIRDGQFALTKLDGAGNTEISVRMRWDPDNQLPAEFFILNPANSNDIYQSYTRIDRPIGLWKPHPDCVHYSYHTNSQDLVTLHGVDGEFTAVNYVETPKNHREGPGSFLNRTFIFVFFVVLSGLLLAWLARRKVVTESIRV